jgi:hypothetical protein
MAIRFTTGMTNTMSVDPIRVTIIHNPSEGYILSHDGDTITEDMSLRDFLKRLLHNIDPTGREVVEREDEIATALRTDNRTRIMHLVHTLDRRYATLIRNKTIVLAAHNYTMGSKGVVGSISETISNNSRTITQSGDGRPPLWDHEKFRQEMEHQGFKMSDGSSLMIADSGKAGDDEVYYLLITPS